MEQYRNPALSPEQRAADLLSHMTLREKVGQLKAASPFFVGAKHTGGVDLVSLDENSDDFDSELLQDLLDDKDDF